MTLGTQVSLAIENARLRDHEKEIAIATERNRLARDLHDAVTQTLFSATLIAEVLPKVWEKNRPEGVKRLAELRQLTRGALAEMRTLLLELRPSALKDAPYADLLRQLCDALNGKSRIPIELHIENEPDLPVEIKIAFYRITQEAFNNIAKHANATQVVIHLYEADNFVNLEIKDNGKGMDQENVPSNHLGIGIMKERAFNINAEIKIESKPGTGTSILLSWMKSF
jgi:signal transduction histidine kinase